MSAVGRCRSSARRFADLSLVGLLLVLVACGGDQPPALTREEESVVAALRSGGYEQRAEAFARLETWPGALDPRVLRAVADRAFDTWDRPEKERAMAVLLRAGRRAVPVLLPYVERPDGFDGYYAAMLLGYLGPEAAQAGPLLARTLKDSEQYTPLRSTSGIALARMGPEGWARLLAALGDADPLTRFFAVRSLRYTRIPLEPARAGLGEPLPIGEEALGRVRQGARRTLGDPFRPARAAAAATLRTLQKEAESEAVAVLVELVQGLDVWARSVAIQELEALPSPSAAAVDALLAAYWVRGNTPGLEIRDLDLYRHVEWTDVRGYRPDQPSDVLFSDRDVIVRALANTGTDRALGALLQIAMRPFGEGPDGLWHIGAWQSLKDSGPSAALLVSEILEFLQTRQGTWDSQTEMAIGTLSSIGPAARAALPWLEAARGGAPEELQKSIDYAIQRLRGP